MFKGLSKSKKFNISSAAIVDPDVHFQQSTRDYCRDAGIEQVEAHSSCAEAWSHIKEGKFDLIILDWLSRGELNPVGLFNRIKNASSTLFTPVLVTAGFTERHDFRLIQEFPLVSLVEKPFTAGVFYQTLDSLQGERAWYLKNTKKLEQISAKSDSIKAIRKHLEFIVNQAPNPAPLAAIYGRILRQRKRFEEAEEVLRYALGSNANHVALLNEIGKLYHVMGRHKQALRYLKRAGSLSPSNTKRLCLIGELELGDNTGSAENSFQNALDIDPWYMRAKEGIGLTKAADKFFKEVPEEPSLIATSPVL